MAVPAGTKETTISYHGFLPSLFALVCVCVGGEGFPARELPVQISKDSTANGR